MAYKNLLSQLCADKAEVFTRFRDFMCKRNGTHDYSVLGIGWTLFDSSYAVDEDNPQLNDWFVMYSVGEDGGQDLYAYVYWISGGFRVWMYQSWDPTAHAGSTNNAGTTTSWLVADALSNLNLWVYGDLDAASPILEVSATEYRPDFFGMVRPVYPDVTAEVATAAGALASGTDISIALDAVPSHWAVDMEVYIRTTHTDDMSTVKIEKITIKTLVSNTITADLVNAYTAGSKVSDHVGVFAQNSTTPFSTAKCLISPGGDISYAMTWGYNTALTPTTYDPESYDGKIGIYEIFPITDKGAIGYFNWLARTPTQNAFFTSLDVLEDRNGDKYRCFRFYNVNYGAVLEV